MAETERRRGEVVERAVRLAEERANRALARGSARGQMADTQRGSAEAVDEARALRPPGDAGDCQGSRHALSRYSWGETWDACGACV